MMMRVREMIMMVRMMRMITTHIRLLLVMMMTAQMYLLVMNWMHIWEYIGNLNF